MAGFNIGLIICSKKKLSAQTPAFIFAEIKVKEKVICVKSFHIDV